MFIYEQGRIKHYSWLTTLQPRGPPTAGNCLGPMGPCTLVHRFSNCARGPPGVRGTTAGGPRKVSKIAYNYLLLRETTICGLQIGSCLLIVIAVAKLIIRSIHMHNNNQLAHHYFLYNLFCSFQNFSAGRGRPTHLISFCKCKETFVSSNNNF